MGSVGSFDEVIERFSTGLLENKMKVTDSVQIDERHSIEFGQATWDETSMSVRDRWATSNGGRRIALIT